MKALVVLTLSSCCTLAMADGNSADVAQQPLIEHYNYGMPLDIARIIATTDVPDKCEVVPMRMTYEDSAGQRHVLEYQVMGNGCSNG